MCYKDLLLQVYDGDHPKDQPKSEHVQLSSKEAGYLAARPEGTQQAQPKIDLIL